MESTSRFVPNDARVVAKVMDGEAIIIDLVSGTYYSLRNAGARTWELLTARQSVAEIAEVAAREYGVSHDVVLADAQALVKQLLEEGLIVETGEGPMEVGASPEPPRTYETPTLEIFREMQDLLALDPPMPGLKNVPWT